MGHPIFNSIPHTARYMYHLPCRVSLVFLILALLQQQHLFFTSRHSLSAKYSATNFQSPNHGPYHRYWEPENERLQFQEELVANRAAWKVLGEGWEGKVFAYKDSVIKTFTPGRSPFRNCAPNMATKWPTEIPASLRFGGISTEDDTNTTYHGFLPVKAHFVASSSPGAPAEWHLVTPLLDGGSLGTLAEHLYSRERPKSHREMDAIFRPAFNRLLTSMSTLHDAGYCHDDIKPSNIFIQDESHWMIGDLGNVREVFHPYHSSRIWTDNGQMGDCRANDAVRALKTYLKFIQSSIADDNEFNVAILGGHEPMSRLFWRTLADARYISAAELHKRSIVEYPEAFSRTVDNRIAKSARHASLTGLFSRRLATKLAVDHALMTRIDERSARWWGMVWLFGLPDAKRCDL
ncbi:SPS1, serine threonine protein kinase [Pyrenophora tritici-repentis]|uniref:Protein kinase domain containing protein n=1 Tax=Pyrenophora tritici-repentis TaxID=45151 RepID=A0A2W1GY23_9PLEO|nr:Protein kinase domain containing protein [Pyrenophora tritici-repentis]KAI1571162.1 SPS1 Serine threonine protein kinase [Pyrenophora tritici-repentis]KAI1674581.1 Protein kinase domain containing protein [Pyrenophora tritici-repentis]KAI1688300.1 Protein kinase domain containing protein [Pyrenophora tritici-repentis]PZD02531.1 SPS1, Serine threonine protein kinase [Pyrenophora tritici-repentis]